MDKEIDLRNEQELGSALQQAQYAVFKSYLHDLQDMQVVQLDSEIKEKLKIQNCIRLRKLTEFTRQKGEDTIQKLTTIYNAVLSMGASLIVMIDAPDRQSSNVNIYLGVRYYGSFDNKNNKVSAAIKTLERGIESQFPGTKLENVTTNTNLPNKNNVEALLNDIFESNPSSISSVSTIASIRNKDKTENKDFIQGIERLIDAMRGNSYTALFIADPVSAEECNNIRSGLETIYTAISPFEKSVWSYNENISNAVMTSLSTTTGTSVTNGTSHMMSHSTSHSTSQTEGKSNGFGVNVGSLIGAGIGALTGGHVGAALGLELGSAIGLNYNHGKFKSDGTQEGTQDGIQDGNLKQEAKIDNETVTNGNTTTNGSGRTLQIENKNKTVTEILEQVDSQIKRLKEGEDYGLYSCGAYFISHDSVTSTIAANTYRALMLGEGTSSESSAVNIWKKSVSNKDNSIEKENNDRVNAICDYLRRFYQPVFARRLDNENYMKFSAATLVSGLELPMHLALPMSSVSGLSVIEHAAFGRNLPACDNGAELGQLYHMGKKIEGTNVQLDINKLTSHTFITGSTGSGKSNTIYKLLDELTKKDIKFLVIEPAKGEYKKIFGGRDDVCVYGTNPFKVPNLLKLNPFSFPDDVHVLEHIDRLVEIFNACWPMYAAMPAILKESIEKAYEECGWNLKTSKNTGVFPTFSTVLEILPTVVDSSAYSSDTSSDYKGALVTRIRSLTRGIHGQIFNDDISLEEIDISLEEIFNRNVIVDLSRVGSQETKSLIMGILTLKLQEFRMSEGCMNSNLRHITVLEEAHNLLRRTSPEQSQESANLQGKSVEMIANSIAEMRAYGEGFIIADQSPGLMDMSVIRNTNTKIILRLPDEGDRQLVGKAAGLNDMQIEEIARLETGVAAIHQNSWLEPVLCKVGKFEDEKPLKFSADTIKWLEDENDVIRKFIDTVYKEYKSSDSKSNNVFTPKEKDIIRKWYIELNVNDKVKHLFEFALNNEPISKDEKILLMRYIVGNKLTKFTDVDDINREITKSLNGKYGIDEKSDTLRNINHLFAENFPKNIR